MNAFSGFFTNSWESGNISQIYERSWHDLHPQKRKNRKDIRNYYSFSLKSFIGKLMKRLINARLISYLEDRKLPVPLKAGFKHHNSTEDQVIHIVQKTEDDFQTKIIIVVWTDM